MRSDEADPGSRLLKGGWRQGSLIEQPGLKVLGLDSFSCGIVLSQDCDLIQSVDLEPDAEIILGYLRESCRPDCLNGHNPRSLDIEVRVGAPPTHAALAIADRVKVPKASLAALSPSSDFVLAGQAVTLLAGWVAKRYTRQAWPDAFNKRLSGSVGKKLENLFKSEAARVISGIWFYLDPLEEELAPEQDYHLSVWLTVKMSVVTSDSEYKSATDFESRLRDLLTKCKGIDLRGSEVRSETDVSLDDLHYYRRFDRDYRSVSPDSQAARPPPGV